MSETTPQIVAILQAIEEDIHDPEGQLQHALHDILRIYGLTAQLAEVVTEQREQIQALAEVITMMHGRMIEHDRRSIALGVSIQSMHLLIEANNQTIAQQASAARALLHEAAAAQLAELEAHAEMARGLLRVARMDAIKVVQRAVHDAQDEIASAASDARDTLAEDRA